MPASDQPNRPSAQAFADRCEAVRARLEIAALGGGERSVERHRARGKLFVRDRVAQLIDPGSTLLELSPLAADQMYTGDIASGGIVTGIGSVAGQLCVIVANDATVKGGTYFPPTVRKHLRAQEIALACNLPCIYLVDSGGAHLPLQAEMFADRDHGGRFFFNQARMSAQGIPQIACVMGSCTAGGAYVPAMCDEAVIVDGTGTIFLGGPPLVQAATGEIVTGEELGGADVHTRISGVADHRASDDVDALARVRDIIGGLRMPSSHVHRVAAPAVSALTAASAADLVLRGIHGAGAFLDAVCDEGSFHRFKERYADTAVCGFARVYGSECAIAIFGDETVRADYESAAHLAELASERNVPLVVVDASVDASWAADRPGQAMFAAILCGVGVPIVTLVVSGTAERLRSIPYASTLLWSWPTADTTATANLIDDGVVLPEDTHRVIALSLASVTSHARTTSPSPSVVRMGA
jgi:acetyl-CoA carboxylase carboxyltransferase component